MGVTNSPLRYPGGKTKIYKNIEQIILANKYTNRLYIEPFAGGFGVGIALLNNNIVQKAVLNDIDIHIYHFWHSVLNCTDDLIRLIIDTPITIEERENQKAIYMNSESEPLLDGFATLYLNRVNYSGILSAGPIGGRKQSSSYKLGCRFNKDKIIERVRQVALLKNKVSLQCKDACELIEEMPLNELNNVFFYVDPPYVLKGKMLYDRYFDENDHRKLSQMIHDNLMQIPWVVSYDDCELVREIYCNDNIHEYEISHSVNKHAQRKELIITNVEIFPE